MMHSLEAVLDDNFSLSDGHLIEGEDIHGYVGEQVLCRTDISKGSTMRLYAPTRAKTNFV